MDIKNHMLDEDINKPLVEHDKNGIYIDESSAKEIINCISTSHKIDDLDICIESFECGDESYSAQSDTLSQDNNKNVYIYESIAKIVSENDKNFTFEKAYDIVNMYAKEDFKSFVEKTKKVLMEAYRRLIIMSQQIFARMLIELEEMRHNNFYQDGDKNTDLGNNISYYNFGATTSRYSGNKITVFAKSVSDLFANNSGITSTPIFGIINTMCDEFIKEINDVLNTIKSVGNIASTQQVDNMIKDLNEKTTSDSLKTFVNKTLYGVARPKKYTMDAYDYIRGAAGLLGPDTIVNLKTRLIRVQRESGKIKQVSELNKMVLEKHIKNGTSVDPELDRKRIKVLNLLKNRCSMAVAGIMHVFRILISTRTNAMIQHNKLVNKYKINN